MESVWVAPIVGGANLTLLALACGIFFHYRRVFPIRGRGSIAGLLSLTTALHVLGVLIGTMRWCPCFLEGVLHMCTTVVASCACSLYALRVLFKFEIAQNLRLIAKLGGVRLPTAKDVGWFLRHRRFVKPVFLAQLAAAHSVPLVLVAILYLFAEPAHLLETCARSKPGMDMMWWTSTIVTMLDAIFCLCCALKISNFKEDGMGYKSELLVTFLSSSIGILALILVSYLGPGPLRAGSIVTIFILMAQSGSAMIVPLAIALKPTLILDVNLLDLEDVLASSVGRPSFLAFLASEFSVENLLFWEAVGVYKAEAEDALADAQVHKLRRVVPIRIATRPRDDTKELYVRHSLSFSNHTSRKSNSRATSSRPPKPKPATHSMLKSAHGVCAKFLQPESRFAVNISAKAYGKVFETIKNSKEGDRCLVTLFQQAQAEVWELLKNDSFPRYLKSKFRADLEAQLAGGMTELVPAKKAEEQRFSWGDLGIDFGEPDSAEKEFSSGPRPADEHQVLDVDAHPITAEETLDHILGGRKSKRSV